MRSIICVQTCHHVSTGDYVDNNLIYICFRHYHLTHWGRVTHTPINYAIISSWHVARVSEPMLDHCLSDHRQQIEENLNKNTTIFIQENELEIVVYKTVAILSRPNCLKTFWPKQKGHFAGALQWRHNKRDFVSNHQPHDCLLKSLFGRRSKKTSKLRVTGLVNSPHKGPVTRKMFPFEDAIMHFPMNFLECKWLYFHSDFTEICS